MMMMKMMMKMMMMMLVMASHSDSHERRLVKHFWELVELALYKCIYLSKAIFNWWPS